MYDSSVPTVTIGLPLRNAGPALDLVLGDLTAQTHQLLQILARDNGSTDDTWARLQSWAAKEPRLTIERAVVDEGGISNFNAVLRMSTGDWFMWAAHDHRYPPDYVSNLLSAASRLDAIAVAPHVEIRDAPQDLWSDLELDDDFAHAAPHRRLRAALKTSGPYALYGMFTNDLAQSHPVPDNYPPDKAFVAALAMRVRIVGAPSARFTYLRAAPSTKPDQAMGYERRGTDLLPALRRELRRAPLTTWERFACRVELLRAMGSGWHRHHLARQMQQVVRDDPSRIRRRLLKLVARLVAPRDPSQLRPGTPR